jgi:hypothetical protein
MVTLRNQDLELEVFNRTFEVQATDARFANDFLDARMIEFLMTRAVGCVTEAVGNRILVARPAGEALDVDGLISLAVGVSERVPDSVRAMSPPLPNSALTPGCPLAADGRPRPGAFAASEDPRYGWVADPGGWASPGGSLGPSGPG